MSGAVLLCKLAAADFAVHAMCCVLNCRLVRSNRWSLFRRPTQPTILKFGDCGHCFVCLLRILDLQTRTTLEPSWTCISGVSETYIVGYVIGSGISICLPGMVSAC